MTIELILFAVLCAGPPPEPQPVRPVPQRIVGLAYPRLAQFTGVHGKVELEAVVSADGSVRDARVVSGPTLLVEAARESLKKWRFDGCTAETCLFKVNFVFELMSGSCDISQCPSDLQIDLPDTITLRTKQALAIIN